MDWQAFYNKISRDKIALGDDPAGRIGTVLGASAQIGYVPFSRNVWYPGGYKEVGNGVFFRGHRYVDMDNCYYGNQNAFLSEANHCALVVLLDRHFLGANHFLAHVSATTDIVTMQVDLTSFFNSIGRDMGRPDLYIFRGASSDVQELDIMMNLFSSVLSDAALEYLALSTHYIQGEGGQNWRAYSSVYVTYRNAAYTLKIAFAR